MDFFGGVDFLLVTGNCGSVFEDVSRINLQYFSFQSSGLVFFFSFYCNFEINIVK